jgi:capsular polysaccharide transport system permease protein
MANEARRQLRGVLRALRGRRVVGWAAIDGEGPVTVEVSINQKPVASGVADLTRPETRNRGLHPTGECGFDIEIPADVPIAEGDVIECTVEGVDGQINRNPARVGRGQTPGEYTLEPVPSAPLATGAADEIPYFGMIPERSRWRVVADVMRALFLREVRNRYGVSRFGYFWAIAQPVIFVTLLQGTRFLLRGRGGFDYYGVNGFYFFQLGVIPWFMFQHGYHQSIGAMRSAKGMYTYRQIQPIDLILIRNSIEFVLMVLTFMVFLLAYEWGGWAVTYVNPVGFLASVVLLYIFTVSFGLIADTMVMLNEEMRRVFTLVDRPLFIMSGVFFTLDLVPKDLQPYLLWNPLLHAVELCRWSMLEHYETPCSFGYLALCTAIILMLALAMYKRNLYRLTS